MIYSLGEHLVMPVRSAIAMQVVFRALPAIAYFTRRKDTSSTTASEA